MLICLYDILLHGHWTAFPYHTLHRQPIPFSRLVAVLCWTIIDCPAKQF